MSADHGWPVRFEAELVRLGLQPARARQLSVETVHQAAECATPPDALFGPAHLYARHLVTELNDQGGPLRGRYAAGPVMLRLTDVGKRYRRRTVFDGVNLTVRAGQVAAIVGANGCGKSTLLRICAGLTRPSSGTVHRTRCSPGGCGWPGTRSREPAPTGRPPVGAGSLSWIPRSGPCPNCGCAAGT